MKSNKHTMRHPGKQPSTQTNYSYAKTHGVTVIKADGTEIKVLPTTKRMGEVDPEREREIRREVRIKCLSLSLPELHALTKVFKKRASEIDKDNAPKMSTAYTWNPPKPDDKFKEIIIKLSYSTIDKDGKVVLGLQETFTMKKLYVKCSDGELLFNINKTTTDNYKFLPYREALKLFRRNYIYDYGLEYYKAKSITCTKFSNLVDKVKIRYARALGDYFVFLEQHGFYAEVDQFIKEDPSLQAAQETKITKLTTEETDTASTGAATIKEGDVICCQLSSVVTVMNTFQCLAEGHVMVKVFLEVLIKKEADNTPFTMKLQAYYCNKCKRLFMYTSEFAQISHMIEDKNYHVFNRFVIGKQALGYSDIPALWASDSILKEAGYEVNQASYLNQKERLDILVALNHRGVSYHNIVSYLNTFINVNGKAANRDMSSAIEKWKSDLNMLKSMYFNGTVK